MSFNTKVIAAASVLALGFATSVFANPAQDVVVNGAAKQPLRSERFGNCVLTKWNADSDICAPAKKEVVVVPAAPEPVTKLAREQLTIYFPFNKSNITPESKTKLDRIADAVNRSPHVTRVGIVGYTDQIGTNSYNNKLSEKRANATQAYLNTRMRLDSSIVGLRGLGKENPVADCKGVTKRQAKIDCMAKDRRTEIEFEFQK